MMGVVGSNSTSSGAAGLDSGDGSSWSRWSLIECPLGHKEGKLEVNREAFWNSNKRLASRLEVERSRADHDVYLEFAGRLCL